MTTTACTGTPYLVNPDVPEEGTDVHHEGPCPAHPDALPEAAHDPTAALPCPECGVFPGLIIGLPVMLMFAPYAATVSTDVSEIADFPLEDLAYNHADGCSAPATTEAQYLAAVTAAGLIALNAAPSLDVTL